MQEVFQDGGTLYLDIDLPSAVLLDEQPDPADDSRRHPNECGAVWYSQSTVSHNDGVISEWVPQEGLGQTLTPAKPHAGASQYTRDGIGFVMGENGGLAAQDALVDAHSFTIAVRVHSDIGEGRSLATLNPDDHKNYLYLYEKDGKVGFADQSDRLQLSLPSPKGPYWAVGSYHLGRLALSCFSEGQTPETVITSESSMDVAASMLGASTLFVGCRSHRKGILKTLGQSVMSDVMLWIDRDCLDDTEGRETLSQACRYAEHAETPE